jgi:hypothetical protein
MIHETPKPTKGWKWGPQYILKPLPSFAKRLGAALTAMSLAWFAYTFLVESHPDWSLYMGIGGAIGAFLTSFFAKK